MFIEHISKSYGKKKILDDVSLNIDTGEVIGILGVNGSGKSTLLNEISKRYSLSKDSGIGYVPQDNPLFDELKPIDNLRMWTDKTKSEIKESLNAYPLSSMDILSFLDTPVSKMSGGMKKRLSIATVLINEPKLLLMDEPFAALDLVAKHDILQFIDAYKSYGNSVLIASHDENIFYICTRVYLLKNGHLYDTDELKNTGRSYLDILRSRDE